MLRIAVPAWRAGPKRVKNLNEISRVSRDELQSLFGGDLTRRKVCFRKLTAREKWRIDMSDRTRDALSQKANVA